MLINVNLYMMTLINFIKVVHSVWYEKNGIRFNANAK